jgi:hypothetical protein
MKGKLLLLALAIVSLSSVRAGAGDSKAPGDLSIYYEFSEGGPASGATQEKYTISNGSLTLENNYIPTEYGSDASKRKKEAKMYQLSADQQNALWTIVSTHGFMDWPASSPQRPAQSGNQTFTIKANGKTAIHSMWEPPIKEKFVDFSRDFLNWAKKVMTVQF